MADASSDDFVNCSYCLAPVHFSAGPRCTACDARIHRECWSENGGCTTFGCVNNPTAKGAVQ